MTWNSLIPGLSLEVDENFIYEVEKEGNRVRKRCLLRDLETISIFDQ